MHWEGVAVHGNNEAMPVGFCASEIQGTAFYAFKLWGLWGPAGIAHPCTALGSFRALAKPRIWQTHGSASSVMIWKYKNHSSSYSFSEGLLAIIKIRFLDCMSYSFVRRRIDMTGMVTSGQQKPSVAFLSILPSAPVKGRDQHMSK